MVTGNYCSDKTCRHRYVHTPTGIVAECTLAPKG